MSASFHEAEAFRALLEAASDAIIVSDAANHILYSNPAAHQIFGYNENEISRLLLPQLMPERFREAHDRGQQRFIASGMAKVIGTTVELAGLHRSG